MKKYTASISNIIQPNFYDNFECTGDKCPVNCCFGWGYIGWKKDEYIKLKNAEMSDVLREKFEHSFTALNGDDLDGMFEYKIQYTNDGKCPMLSPEGLCLVQKELGAEYLSKICRIYPRTGKIYGNIFIRTCDLSCNHVTHTITNDENGMELEIHKSGKEIEWQDVCGAIPYTAHDHDAYPVLNHEFDIFNFFYNILSDNTRSIETSIVLGAMAAQNLDKFIEKKQYDKIPAVLKALEQQINDPNQIEKLENAKPNLSLKANFAGGLIKHLKNADTYKIVFENGHSSEEKWNEGLAKWNAAYKDKPFALRNIALNIYISNHLPFRDKTYSIFDNYCYFVSEFAVIKFLAAAMPVKYDKNVEETFEVSAAYIDRNFTHDMPNFPKIVEYIKTFGANTPAMLLGIIK